MAKRILSWTDPMRDWSVKPAIPSRLKEKSVYRPDVMAVTRGRMFTAAGLAAGASVVM